MGDRDWNKKQRHKLRWVEKGSTRLRRIEIWRQRYIRIGKKRGTKKGGQRNGNRDRDGDSLEKDMTARQILKGRGRNTH
jgi:hypothetical protein